MVLRPDGPDLDFAQAGQAAVRGRVPATPSRGRFSLWPLALGLLALGLLVAGCGRDKSADRPPARQRAAQPVAETNVLPSPVQTSLPDEYPDSEAVQALGERQRADVRLRLQEYCGTARQPRWPQEPAADAARLERGAALFRGRCAGCHGVGGDGAGPSADEVEPRPRDFRRGVFKFVSTRFGAKPVREDLSATLRQGLPGTAMPSFADLPVAELDRLVEHVVLLSQRGELEFLLANEADGADEPLEDELVRDLAAEVVRPWLDAPGQVVEVGPAPPGGDKAIERGRVLFQSEKLLCYKCHAIDGRGMPDYEIHPLKDNWGRRSKAFDLSAGQLRRGASDVELYRRIVHGIPGTPMPVYEQVLADDANAVWDLVRYVQQIAAERRQATPATPEK